MPPQSALEQLADRYADLLADPPPFPADMNPGADLLQFGTVESLAGAAHLQLLAAQRGAAGRDLGFKLTTGYQENSALGLADLNEGPYRNRWQIGLEWDLLRDGWLVNRSERGVLTKQIAAEKARRPALRREENLERLRALITYVFSRARLPLLEKRRQFLKELGEIGRQRVWSDDAMLEEYAAARAELERAERQWQDCRTYIDLFPRRHGPLPPLPEARQLPPLTLDIEALAAHLGNPPWRSLQEEWLRRDGVRNFSYWSEVRVRLFFHYMDYFRDPSHERFFTYGLQLTLPLHFAAEKRKSVRWTELEWEKARLTRDTRADMLEALGFQQELLTKIDDFKHFIAKRRVCELRLRRLYLERRYGKRSRPLDIARQLGELLDIDIELLTIRQQMYLRLASALQHTALEDVRPFLKPVEWSGDPGVEADVYPGERYLYVWSGAFQAEANDFLLEFCRVRSIRNILLSTGKSVDRAKLADFMRRARAAGLEVFALIGDSSWLTTGKSGLAEADVDEALALGFDGVHLDVEPQQRGDWERNRDVLARRYLEMMESVRRRLGPQRRFSVSVLPGYPPAMLEKVYALCDHVFLMVYAKTEAETIAAKAAPAVLDPAKTVISLRPGDFTAEWEMESLIARLMADSGYRAFAFHDLASLLKLWRNHAPAN